MPKQKPQLVLENDVIQGFSYSFSKLLLEKLRALKKEDGIFEDGLEKAQISGYCSEITPIACCVILSLRNQVSDTRQNSDCYFPIEINGFVSFIKEFLTIFETKKKKGK